MGSNEKGLRDRYAVLATELGDLVTKIRLATRRQSEIEREIDALNAAIPAAVDRDRKETPEAPKAG